MRSNNYRVVVIGGGIVGASVLYHLTALGWQDVLLIERSELTAGSTWHAAADFHTLNSDPTIAALQKYTIDLYPRLEEITGRSCGIKTTGGIQLAATEHRWEWLQAQWATYQTIGNDGVRLITREEVADLAPIVDVSTLYGGMWNSHEGHVDASGTTHAYAAAAKLAGAEVVLHNRVMELNPTGDGWQVVTEHGTIHAEHVVDAGGLWARRVARMAGTDLPVTPMEHHYLITEAIPAVAERGGELPVIVDLDGYTYLRQEGQGLLLGVYEHNAKLWNIDGAPWDFGMTLLAPDPDRIMPELEVGLARFPCLETAGIKNWVNGAFTFSPDGNPLVGPVPGVPGFWSACGVMAGFSQGGGVGLTLAEWLVEGEPSRDVSAMDVARFGDFACADGYLAATSRQFYARRFEMPYPNEELPAGRPLRTSPIHDDLAAIGARFGVTWGLEYPRYVAPDPDFVEIPSLKRSNAFDLVGAEARAIRAGVGVADASATARFEVSGPAAQSWLEHLLAGPLPEPGATNTVAMLTDSGNLAALWTVICWSPEEFWLLDDYDRRAWLRRWFTRSPCPTGTLIRDRSDEIAGLSVLGPQAEDLLRRAGGSVELAAGEAGRLNLGLHRVWTTRAFSVGENRFDLHVGAPELRSAYRALLRAGADLPVSVIGADALESLRLETSTGAWGREYRLAQTPAQAGLTDLISTDREFVGSTALTAPAATDPVLVTLQVEAVDADASGFEPIWAGERQVGHATSGGYGHTLGMSLALAYVAPEFARPGTELEIQVVGVRRPAVVIEPDPAARTSSTV